MKSKYGRILGVILQGSTQTRRIFAALALLGVLTAGTYLRFTHTHDLGPRLWDEGIYLQEARFGYTFLQALSQSIGLRLREARTGEDLWKRQEELARIRSSLRGEPPIFGRLHHDLAILVGMTVWGPESPSVGTRVSALAGSLSLGVFHLLARRLYGARAALLATTVFSLLGYHIHYSRSSMAEATTLLFLLVSLYFYAGSRTGRTHVSLTPLALASLFLGVSFVTHNRMLVMFGMLLIFESTLWRRPLPVGSTRPARRILIFLLFFTLPLLAWETAYYLLLLTGKHLGILVSAPTYFEQVFVATGRSALWNHISKVWRLDGLLTFPYLLWRSSGSLLLFLTLLGLGLSLRRRSFADLFVGAWFLVPYVFYGITTAGLSRTYTLILPAVALLAGSVFRADPGQASGTPGQPQPHAGSFRASGTLVFGIVFLAVLGSGLYHGHRATLSRDGYAEAVTCLRLGEPPAAAAGGKVITTNVPVLRVYLGESQVADRPPASRGQLAELVQQGFRTVLVDYNRALYALFQRERVEILDEIALSTPPEWTISNPFVRDPLTVFEANLFFWDTLRLLEEMRGSGLDEIRIYRLDTEVK